MRNDLPGMGRRRLLLSDGKGFNATEKGMRRKKSIKGNTVNQDVVQINMKVTKHSSKPIDSLLSTKKDEGDSEEKPKEEEKKEEQ